MKAIVYAKYGSPEVLHVEEVEEPRPKEDEVLVQVHATSVNAADLDHIGGSFMVRPGGLFRPKYRILGSDIAGRVVSAGAGATRFKAGDEVYADLTEFGFGAFAEYVSVPERALASSPAGLTMEEAASVPSAGGVAFLNLLARGPIEPDQKVLINGAGGGMGTFAVQIAKSYGAEVTAVDKPGKLEVMTEAGADHVVDYTRNDFTASGQQYDLVLDVAAYRSVRDCARVLRPGAHYVLVGGSMRRILGAMILGPNIQKRENKHVGLVMAYPDRDTLDSLTRLIEAGQVSPVIDRCYPLGEISDAFRYLASGDVKGKVVVTVA